jgi:hypothetical protein
MIRQEKTYRILHLLLIFAQIRCDKDHFFINFNL